MRQFLLLLLFLLSSSIYAETVPATLSGNYWYSNYPGCGASNSASCTYTAAGNSICSQSGSQNGWGSGSMTGPAEPSGVVSGGYPVTVQCHGNINYTATIFAGASAYSCPSGDGWTLSGQMCTRPDQDKCASKAGESSYGWITRTIGGASPYGSYCSGGCSQYVSGPVAVPGDPSLGYYTDGKTRTEYAKWQFDGSSCTSPDNSPSSATPSPPTTPKKPPCSASEGVMTSSSGAVHCVPEGTPSSNPPVVKKESTTTTTPDGSTVKQDTTTTRDPSTGVEDKQTTTTTTSPGGSTSVQSSSGTSGTGTNATGTPDGTGQNDLCAKNPTLQICKGGMSEEGTQKKVLDEAEKIRKALAPEEEADKTKLDQAKSDYEEKSAAHVKLFDDLGAKGQSDEGVFSWALLPDLPGGGCTPFTGIVLGRSITIDVCDQVAKIRDIGGYALYFFTAFTLFSIAVGMNSGGRK